MHFFSLIYFNNHPPHVSNRLAIHHEKVDILYVQHVMDDPNHASS